MPNQSLWRQFVLVAPFFFRACVCCWRVCVFFFFFSRTFSGKTAQHWSNTKCRITKWIWLFVDFFLSFWLSVYLSSLLFALASSRCVYVYDIRTCASDDNRATEFMYEVILVHCYSILRLWMRSDRCDRARKTQRVRENERKAPKTRKGEKERWIWIALRVSSREPQSLFLFSDGFFLLLLYLDLHSIHDQPKWINSISMRMCARCVCVCVVYFLIFNFATLRGYDTVYVEQFFDRLSQIIRFSYFSQCPDIDNSIDYGNWFVGAGRMK